MKGRKRRTIYEITGKQIAVTLLIATFALTLVFFIGVYVGKNAVTNISFNDQVSADTSGISEKFKETIRSAIRKNPVKEEKGTDEQKAPIETLLEKPDIFSSEARSNKNLDQKDTITDNIKPDRKIETTSKEKEEPPKTKIDEKRYTVKVGTFTAYENAKKLFDSLKKSGYNPQIKMESNQEINFYHVIVGEFDSIEKAKEYGNSIRDKLEYINDYVIKEVIK